MIAFIRRSIAIERPLIAFIRRSIAIERPLIAFIRRSIAIERPLMAFIGCLTVAKPRFDRLRRSLDRVRAPFDGLHPLLEVVGAPL